MRVRAVVKITEADGTVTLPGGTLTIGPEDCWLVEQGLAVELRPEPKPVENAVEDAVEEGPVKPKRRRTVPDEGGEG